MFEKFWIFHEAQELAQERQGLLLQRLGISDITVCDFPALFLKLLGPEDNRPPHRIFSGEQPGIQSISRQHDRTGCAVVP
jgi:hypothetical protein